jgi:hypothetical protein
MMAIGIALRESLQSFAQVESEIIAFGRSADASKALEFVHMRKRMINEFAALRDALENDPYLKANEDRKTEIMRLFSAFRTQNAINQANWPAIRVKDNLPDFRIAAQAVGPFSKTFWSWIENEFGYRRTG